MTDGLRFTLEQTSGRARLGRLETAHGHIATPVFMPVGTAATVKAMLPASVAQTGARILLANTYHLLQRPGIDLIKKLGGLRPTMAWEHAILTDSGGFQIMSLAGLAKLDDAGVRFRSHIDGSKLVLTPESAVEAQVGFDATIAMVLDECIGWPADFERARGAMVRSCQWARRSLTVYPRRPGYGLFAIVQGSFFPALRRESALQLGELPFDGFAVGGLAVGESQTQMLDMTGLVTGILPAGSPRYAMGVGKPDDIIRAVAEGIDMFDCVLPTRSGRTGQAFTAQGRLNILNSRYRQDEAPVEAGCPCPACQKFSRGYLRHLFAAREILGAMLLTWHNLCFYQRLMQSLQQAIRQDRFAAVSAALLAGYNRDQT